MESLEKLERILNRPHGPPELLLREVARLLTRAFGRREVAYVRVTFGGVSYPPKECEEGCRRLSAPIINDGAQCGLVELCLREAPRKAGGSALFSAGEVLLGLVAERLSAHLRELETRHRLHKAKSVLRREHQRLVEARCAIRSLSSLLNRDRAKVRRGVAANFEKILLPLLARLESEVSAEQRESVRLVRASLEGLTSARAGEVSLRTLGLTPAEVEVCHLLRLGLCSKEIAQFRHCAVATVSRQRESIRHKLGLAGQKVNLVSFLRGTNGGEIEAKSEK